LRSCRLRRNSPVRSTSEQLVPENRPAPLWQSTSRSDPGETSLLRVLRHRAESFQHQPFKVALDSLLPVIPTTKTKNHQFTRDSSHHGPHHRASEDIVENYRAVCCEIAVHQICGRSEVLLLAAGRRRARKGLEQLALTVAQAPRAWHRSWAVIRSKGARTRFPGIQANRRRQVCDWYSNHHVAVQGFVLPGFPTSEEILSPEADAILPDNPGRVGHRPAHHEP
jgi:hypothetical protein